MKRMIDQELFDEKLDAAGVETLLASGDVPEIQAGEVLELMDGYSFTNPSAATLSISYASVVKTGNKITFAISGFIYSSSGYSIGENLAFGTFHYPAEIGAKLIPNISTNRIGYKPFRVCKNSYDGSDCNTFFTINDGTSGYFSMGFTDAIAPATNYYFRFEETFLLSDNMVPAP